jgi:hypothetical protein
MVSDANLTYLVENKRLEIQKKLRKISLGTISRNATQKTTCEYAYSKSLP